MSVFEEKLLRVSGGLSLPGDKSISHRAVILSAMADGTSIIKNISDSLDVKSTIRCVEELGCVARSTDRNEIEIIGKGFRNFTPPSAPLNAGNSGTTARLLSGLLAAQKFGSVIIGDESLSRRPMKRIVDPLTDMGWIVKASDNRLPIEIYPSPDGHPIDYTMNIPSAQIKSSLLLAGLHLENETIVREPLPTRNHTENLLGLETTERETHTEIRVSSRNYPVPREYFVPSDFSSASFFIVLALLRPGSELCLENVLLNETRTGLIGVLKRMGAEISIINRKIQNREPYGDIIVKSSALKNCPVGKEIIPNIIDEIPILSVAGIFAEGDFEIEGIGELRFKESDRIHAICENMKLAGIEVNEFKDGFKLSGDPSGKRVRFTTFGDHRIAMAFSIFSLLNDHPVDLDDAGSVGISNPGFFDQLSRISIFG